MDALTTPAAATTFEAVDLDTGEELCTWTLANYDEAGGDLYALRADARAHGDHELVAAVNDYMA